MYIWAFCRGGGGGVKQLQIAASPLWANGRPWYLGPLGKLEPSPYFECAELKNQGFGPQLNDMLAPWTIYC